jgi:hypothetical protein
MVNPYKRVILALSYMKGPNILDWKADERKKLNTKVTRAANPIAHTDEVLWNGFRTNFETAFTNTSKKQIAIRDLMQLRMHKGDLDPYIAKFAHLALHTGYDRNALATVNIFARGLNPKLADACINRDTMPNNTDLWECIFYFVSKLHYINPMARPIATNAFAFVTHHTCHGHSNQPSNPLAERPSTG